MSAGDKDDILPRDAATAERARMLRRAVADKSIHSLAKDPAFPHAIAKLCDDALSENTHARTDVLAALGRVHATNKIKALEPTLRDAIQKLLAEPLPPINIDDGDDRYYLAACCRHTNAEWIAPYLASTAVREESHEKARHEAVRGLVEKTPHVEAAIALLADAMRAWVPDTEFPSDSAARRTKRLLVALGEVISTFESDNDCLPGRPLGETLQAVVKGGVPPSAKVLSDVAHQVLSVVHALIRSQFSLATEVSTYNAVRVVREWFPKGGWARWLSQEDIRHARLSLERDVLQALTLLAKQGTCDDGLFEQLVVITGSRDEAREKAKNIAIAVRGLAPEVQAWLNTGEHVQRMESALPGTSLSLESRMHDENSVIAHLLRDAGRFTAMGETLRGHLLPELDIVAPQYVGRVERLLAQVNMIAQGVNTLADGRRLRMRGHPGDVEEYAPIAHQIVEGHNHGSIRWVRLIESVIERQDDDGITHVVERALVEPALSSEPFSPQD